MARWYAPPVHGMWFWASAGNRHKGDGKRP